MTSKTSFSKLFLFDLKRNIPLYIIGFLVILFTGPFTLLMTIDTFLSNAHLNREAIISNLGNYLTGQYSTHSVVAAVLGGFFAIMVFSYLYSKSAVDMYHSLPIKRINLYIIRYMEGFLPGVIILVINCALSYAALAINGMAVKSIVSSLNYYTIIVLLSFFMVYNVAVIAVMLTGNKIIGILGTFVLSIYNIAATLVVNAYCQYCFQTYYNAGETEPYWHLLLNPLGVIEMIDSSPSDSTFRLIVVFVEGIVLSVIGFLLYDKRPSEAAGKPLCYQISKPIIRIPIVILVALSGGVYIWYTSSVLSVIWYWISFVVAAIIAHVVIDIIIEQDVKAAFKHPVQLIMTIALGIVVSIFFQYDLGGYDTYIPPQEKIASVGVRLFSIENEITLFEFGDGYDSIRYGDISKTFLKKLVLDDETPVHELAKAGINSLNPVRSAMDRHIQLLSMDNNEPEQNMYVICYRLRSGDCIYRQYGAPIEDTYESCAAIYESIGYKELLYKLSDYLEADMIMNFKATNIFDETLLTSSDIDYRELLAALRDDLYIRTLDTLRDEQPILYLSSFDENSYDDFLRGYYIYPSDAAACEYLKENGFDPEELKASFDIDAIEKICVTTYDYSSPVLDNATGTWYTQEEDSELIKSLCNVMVPERYAYINNVLHPVKDNVSITIYNYGDQGDEYKEQFKIPYDYDL